MTEEIEGAGASGGPGLMPLIVVIIVVIAAAGGFVLYNEFIKPNINPNEIDVTLKINYGNETIIEESLTTENNTPLGVLEASVGYEDLDISGSGTDTFLNKINGIGPGDPVPGISDTSAYYWMWYLNNTNEIIWTAANAYEVFDGSTVEWRFETF